MPNQNETKAPPPTGASAPPAESPLNALVDAAPPPEAVKKPPDPIAMQPADAIGNRKPNRLYVFANPWHGPVDHHHRAQTAVAWDPDNHNPDRGFVGAVHRLDDEGHLYFEFAQFDHEHRLLEGAEPIELPEYGEKGRSHYYIAALRSRELLAADPVTHKKAFGHATHFRDPREEIEETRLARLAATSLHCSCGDEEHGVKPMPKKGEGRIGLSTGHRSLAAVAPAPSDNPKGALRAALTTSLADLHAKGSTR